MFRKSESKRINILRAYFAVMVVFIHMYNAEIGSTGNVAFDGIEYILSRIVSGVAVPGFLLISSVLLYKKEFTWKDNVIKKIKRLVVPYLILNTFWVCFFAVVQQSPLQYWFSGERNNIVANWGLYDWFDAYFINPLLWPLWYLKSLFIFNIFAKVIKSAVDKFPKLSFLCILVLYFVFGGSVPVIRFDALFYFVTGYYIVKYDLHFRDLEKIRKIYITLAYILLIALVYVTRGTAVNGAADKLCVMAGLVFFAAFQLRHS